MKNKFTGPFFFALILALVFILPLGERALFSPDEDRYAEIAREMLVRNDFVTPYLNGIVYFEKPVLGHWLHAFSMKLFGENRYALRLPSMLAALLTALLMALLAKRYAPADKDLPYLAAGFTITVPMISILGTMCILDNLFSFFLTLGMFLFYLAVEDREKLWTKRTLLLQFFCGISFGFAFLTKGFLAFLIPGSAIAVYMLLPEKWRDWKQLRWWPARVKEALTLPWIPLFAMVCTALPWSVAIHRAQPLFWRYFFWEEHIQRFSQKLQHPKPIWFFIPILLAGLAYFLPLLYPAFRGLQKRISASPLIKYLLCWFGIPFIVLSFSSGKLGTYILPCFPPLMLLLAIGIGHWCIQEGHVCFVRIYAKILGSVMMAGAVGFVLYHRVLPEYMCLYKNNEILPLDLLLLIGFSAGICFFIASRKEMPPLRRWILAGLGLIPFFLFWQLLIPELVIQRKAPEIMLEEVRKRFGSDAELFSDSYPFQSVCWVFKRDDVQMFIRAGELDRGIELSKAFHRRVLWQPVFDRIKDPKRKKPLLMVLPLTTQKFYLKYLPKPKSIYTPVPDDPATYTVLQY